MAYNITFSILDDKQRAESIDTMQKIASIEAEIIKISDERANAEAAWRKRENFLNTEKGKLQIYLRQLQQAQIIETE